MRRASAVALGMSLWAAATAAAQTGAMSNFSSVQLTAPMGPDRRLSTAGLRVLAPIGLSSGLLVDASTTSLSQWTALAEFERQIHLGSAELQMNGGAAVTSRYGAAAVGGVRLIRSIFGVELSGGVEREPEIEPAALPLDTKPFVLVGTVSTPSTPVETLTVAQVAQRESGKGPLVVRSVLTPTLRVAARNSAFDWSGEVGFPTSCCGSMPQRLNSHRPWMQLTIDRAVTPLIGLVAGAGTRQLFSSNVPTTDRAFVSLGFSVRHFVPPATIEPTAVDQPSDAATAITFTVSALDSSEMIVENGEARAGRRYYVIRSWAPRATSVRIRGDFSAWEPLALARLDGGVWEIRLPLSAGYHSISTQIDMGAWGIPPGVAHGVSDYGDDVGVILIRGEER